MSKKQSIIFQLLICILSIITIVLLTYKYQNIDKTDIGITEYKLKLLNAC